MVIKKTKPTKKEKINKVLILGSGGLSIGQAGEFDYSGSQAIKALKEEGIRTILINPNIATIQTSWNFADRVYFLPVTKNFVKRIIEKESPQGLLLSFGGQTALNCGIELYRSGILKKYNVKILGTPIKTIIKTEDKGLFAKELSRLDVRVPTSITVSNIDDGIVAAKKIGFPLFMRVGFALGGLGSGFCNDNIELKQLLTKAFSYSNQILVEESLKGWKEVEYEVIRDRFDNCITVCNMENLDPLGIHTGESIVVAPSQTLSDHEYHKLRSISIKVVKALGIVGECNVQFALDPKSEDYRVIEVNARLSRSSALASKATGYPLAFIAAKLAIGKNLINIKNPVTKKTKAFFEPALDYIVVKFPRWDHEKFTQVKPQIESSMKSVGEVMAIGRKFEEALQKSIRMINPALSGITDNNFEFIDLDEEIKNPTDKRIFALIKALRKGYSIEMLHEMTMIDKWFLYKLKNIVAIDNQLVSHNKIQEKSLTLSIDHQLLRTAKKHGFSDRRIAECYGTDEYCVREYRKKNKILPVIKQIDTLAAEYPAETNYLYLTYNAAVDDIKIGNKGIIVLGGGPYSIGSSVEFDWCCVECIKTIRKEQIPAIIINNNPETVSTDYDECDRLYFEELTLERILDIHDKEKEIGIIVSMGGQIPNTLSLPLSKNGVKILGTDPLVIDQVEDRHKFSKILDDLDINQPEWKELNEIEDIRKFSGMVGFPILIRPSYVLSGSAMHVAYNKNDLKIFLKKAMIVSNGHPVVLTKFITGAKEIDMDIVAQDGEIKVYAISEHIENAGVHSGDATLVTPAQKLYLATINKIEKISRKVIKHLNVTGPVNIQFIAKDNHIKIIECNLRSSRSFPFVSKVYNINFIELATKAIMKKTIQTVKSNAFDLDYVGVKAPQFSFTRLRGADPNLGVEMASTGEVACIGKDTQEAFLKALLSTGFKIPKKSILLSTGGIKEKAFLLESVRQLKETGYILYATKGTADFYGMHGIDMVILNWPLDDTKPNIMDYLINKKIELVINIPKNNEKIELSNDYCIRRAASDFSVPLITNVNCSILLVKALLRYKEEDLEIRSWGEYIIKQ
jgi:carbamoyl-phosphate synthase large subunit